MDSKYHLITGIAILIITFGLMILLATLGAGNWSLTPLVILVGVTLGYVLKYRKLNNKK